MRVVQMLHLQKKCAIVGLFQDVSHNVCMNINTRLYTYTFYIMRSNYELLNSFLWVHVL